MPPRLLVELSAPQAVIARGNITGAPPTPSILAPNGEQTII